MEAVFRYRRFSRRGFTIRSTGVGAGRTLTVNSVCELGLHPTPLQRRIKAGNAVPRP
jgi:hypothetical protein